MHIQRQADSFAYRLGMAWQDWAEHIQNYRPTESPNDRAYYSDYMECPAGGGCDHPDGTHARYLIDHVGKGDQSDMSYLRYRHTYNQFTGKPQLQVEALKTHPDHQHDGVAESLVRKMHEDHPGIPISPGEMTQAGYGFFQNLLEKDPSYQDIIARKLLSHNTIRCAMPMMYHHTLPESAEAIRREKRFNPPDPTDDFSYFSDQPNGAGRGYGPSRVDLDVPDAEWHKYFEPDPYDTGNLAPPNGELHWRARSESIKPEWILSRKLLSSNTIRCAAEYTTLYHNTTPEAAQEIIHSGSFRPGDLETHIWFNSDPEKNRHYGPATIPIRIPTAELEELESEGIFAGGLGVSGDDWAILPEHIKPEWIHY